MAKFKGVQLCQDALDRLLSGEPNRPEHIGVEKDEITAAKVSVEAGFDKGYLKRSRPAHIPIITKIDDLQIEGSSSGESTKLKLRGALRNAKKLRSEKLDKEKTLDRVLTQNLMLLERVRELEKQLARYQNKVNF